MTSHPTVVISNLLFFVSGLLYFLAEWELRWHRTQRQRFLDALDADMRREDMKDTLIYLEMARRAAEVRVSNWPKD